MPQPAVFMLIGLGLWVIVSLVVARRLPKAEGDTLHGSAEQTRSLGAWAEALCQRAQSGQWPQMFAHVHWTTAFDRVLQQSSHDARAARRAMLEADGFAVQSHPGYVRMRSLLRVGTGLSLVGLGLAMLASLGQIASVTSDESEAAVNAAPLSVAQAGEVGVAALVLLGSAALMNLIARRTRKATTDHRSLLQQRVEQSLVQSMASEAAGWMLEHADRSDARLLAERLRQFWDVSSGPAAAAAQRSQAEQAA
jgi:hypothetical protein